MTTDEIDPESAPPPPPAPAAKDGPPDSHAWARLDSQLRWYSAKAASSKRNYHGLKVAQIVVAAVIPVTAALGASAAVAGSLGAVIVVLEGLQQLFQYQQNWIGFRATAEALKHEQYLFLSRAGPYRETDRDALLAERVEALISNETATWVDRRSETTTAAS